MPIPPPTAEEVLEGSPYKGLTESIIAAGIEVHRHLGSGLSETPYREALGIELRVRGHHVVEEKVVPVFYKGQLLRARYRLDILVDDAVVVEVKAINGLAETHRAQALSYLRATRLPVALVMNFAGPTLTKGLLRVLNWPIPEAL